ncbi:hypothetical protein PR001_g22417, partial [Phytophthora rubi]
AADRGRHENRHGRRLGERPAGPQVGVGVRGLPVRLSRALGIQSVIALSSTTAEFIAASDGLQQAELIKLVAMEVLTATTQDGPADLPLTLQIDNQSTIKRVKKDGTSGAQKAVDIRFHCLKEAWKTGFVALEYVPMHENPADLLTKALSRHELAHKRALCGMSQ